MFPRLPVLLCLSVLLLPGCQNPFKKQDETDRKIKAGEEIADQSKDPTFQAFVGRLRTAAGKRDREMLASMMAAPFGYRWDPAPIGETVFDYWDFNNVWPELEATLREPFTVFETYMVAVTPRYRLGLRRDAGSWRFAYFVPVEGADQ